MSDQSPTAWAPTRSPTCSSAVSGSWSGLRTTPIAVPDPEPPEPLQVLEDQAGALAAWARIELVDDRLLDLLVQSADGVAVSAPLPAAMRIPIAAEPATQPSGPRRFGLGSERTAQLRTFARDPDAV